MADHQHHLQPCHLLVGMELLDSENCQLQDLQNHSLQVPVVQADPLLGMD